MGDVETMEGVNEKDPSSQRKRIWYQQIKENTKILTDEIKTIKGGIMYL